MRRGYRIKLIRDGAGGSQGIQPGWLTGKKNQNSLLRDVKYKSAALASLMQSQQVEGLLLGPCIAHVCRTGTKGTYTLKKKRRWSSVTHV